MNQFKLNKKLDCYEMELHDKFFNHIGDALIDICDYDKLKDWNWTLNNEGYIVGRHPITKERSRMSKVILGLENTRIKVKYSNGDKFDNRRSNLDSGDVKKKIENSRRTDIKGVTEKNGNYEVTISYKGKRTYLGSSKNKTEALIMRKRAEYALNQQKEIKSPMPLLYIPPEDYELNFDRRTNQTLNDYYWNPNLLGYEMNIYNRQNQCVAVCIIDPEDYPRVKEYKWGLNHGYITSKINGREVRLSRFILNINDGSLVQYLNGNSLDNRKYNFRTDIAQTVDRGIVLINGIYVVSVITRDRKLLNLGTYTDLLTAIAVRNRGDYEYGYYRKSPLKYLPYYEE